MDILNSWNTPQTLPSTGSHQNRVWCDTICVNGKLQSAAQPFIGLQSSIVNEGLFFAESFICKGNMPYLWREHYTNIVKSMNALTFNSKAFPSSGELLRQIEILTHRNKYPAYSRVQVVVWNEVDDRTSVCWSLHQERLGNVNPYEAVGDKRQIMIGLYEELLLGQSSLSWVKMASPIFAFAQQYAMEAALDAACICNANGRIATTTIGNIYLCIGKEILATHTDFGARRNAIENTLELVCKEIGMSVKYTDGLTVEMMNSAQECFVAGAEFGIRAIAGFEKKRYYKSLVFRIAKALQEHFIF